MLVGKEYTDASLEEIVKGWRSEITSADRAAAAQQENIRNGVKEKLALFMIRRDENSRIHGKRVIADYFKLCHVYEYPLMPIDYVQLSRETLQVLLYRF